MTPLLYDILIRFRYYPVALTADIEKPFLQISVANEDRDFLRFLWVENVFNEKTEIVKNSFTRVVFGVNNSPAQLNGTVRKHADKYVAADQHFTVITAINTVLFKKLKTS